MEKQSYLRRLAAKLEEWDREIEQLRTRTQQLDEKARAELNPHIDALKAKKQDLLKRFEKMRETSDEAFDDLKIGATAAWEDMDHAWADIRQAVEKAMARFSRARSQKAEKL